MTVKRLDTILADLPVNETSRIYLKMDTQGFDSQVVKGAAGAMHRIVAMQSEVPGIRPLYLNEPDMLEILNLYRSLNFAPTGFFPLDFEEDGTTVTEFDVVLARFASTAQDSLCVRG